MNSDGESCRIGYCGKKPLDQFLMGLRLSFGLWLLYLGISKWSAGASAFVAHVAESFAQTWMPGGLTVAAGWVIVIAEPLLGIWLISGRKPKAAWFMTALLMIMLMFGQTVTSQFAIVANNWQYVVLCLFACSWSERR